MYRSRNHGGSGSFASRAALKWNLEFNPQYSLSCRGANEFAGRYCTREQAVTAIYRLSQTMQ